METVLRMARKEAESLLERPDVVGVGIGSLWGEPRIVISIAGLFLKASFPAQIGGVPTRVVVTGPFIALQDRTARWRPAPGGVSVGHKDVTAGTLGCLVTDSAGDRFILSNNHVLAASNEAQRGDEILQPGVVDGGTVPDDVLATLADFILVEFLLPECPFAAATVKSLNALCGLVGSRYSYSAARPQQATNLVDAAIARPLVPGDVTPDVLGLPTPSGHSEVELGDAVVKSGRTTGVTVGTVTQVDATLQVMYANNIAVFEQQIVSNVPCGPGDSGSIVLADDGSGDVVGLLFAGTQDGSTMIMSRIANVLDLLGVTIGG